MKLFATSVDINLIFYKLLGYIFLLPPLLPTWNRRWRQIFFKFTCESTIFLLRDSFILSFFFETNTIPLATCSIRLSKAACASSSVANVPTDKFLYTPLNLPFLSLIVPILLKITSDGRRSPVVLYNNNAFAAVSFASTTFNSVVFGMTTAHCLPLLCCKLVSGHSFSAFGFIVPKCRVFRIVKFYVLSLEVVQVLLGDVVD